MPATIKMSLSNGNPTSAQIAAFRGYSNLSPVPKTTQIILYIIQTQIVNMVFRLANMFMR